MISLNAGVSCSNNFITVWNTPFSACSFSHSLGIPRLKQSSNSSRIKCYNRFFVCLLAPCFEIKFSTTLHWWLVSSSNVGYFFYNLNIHIQQCWMLDPTFDSFARALSTDAAYTQTFTVIHNCLIFLCNLATCLGRNCFHKHFLLGI